MYMGRNESKLLNPNYDQAATRLLHLHMAFWGWNLISWNSMTWEATPVGSTSTWPAWLLSQWKAPQNRWRVSPRTWLMTRLKIMVCNRWLLFNPAIFAIFLSNVSVVSMAYNPLPGMKLISLGGTALPFSANLPRWQRWIWRMVEGKWEWWISDGGTRIFGALHPQKKGEITKCI